MLQVTSFYHLVCVGVAAIGCLVVWPDGALGVLVGGVLMAGNFWVLRAMMRRILSGAANRTKLIYAILLALKLVAVMGVMAVLVLVIDINPIGLALGMATLFFGVGLTALHAVFRPNLFPPQQSL